MYYVMRASAPSLHRESTDSLINDQLEQQPYCVVYMSTIAFSHSCGLPNR